MNTWVEIINNASGTIGLFVAFFSGLIIALYQVRVHHKVLFRERGELNFITLEDMRKVEASKHEFCPVHTKSMSILTKVELTQANNIAKLSSLEESLKESAKSREEIHKTLNSINVNMATLIANMSNMANNIQELKK